MVNRTQITRIRYSYTQREMPFLRRPRENKKIENMMSRFGRRNFQPGRAIGSPFGSSSVPPTPTTHRRGGVCTHISIQRNQHGPQFRPHCPNIPHNRLHDRFIQRADWCQQLLHAVGVASGGSGRRHRRRRRRAVIVLDGRRALCCSRISVGPWRSYCCR